MALSLALHGLAILLLFAIGAAGSSSSEPALFVELALVATAVAEAEQETVEAAAPPAPPTAEQPPPPTPESEIAVELAPLEEPPPVDFSELRSIEPPKPQPPPPPKPEPSRPVARQVAAKSAPAQNFNTPGDAQQAAAGFMNAPIVVWEGKPRYRHPPTPAVYPPRAIELNQQGEALIRVRLDPTGAAVEIVLHRSSGFALLDRAALAAVRGWHFLPAVRGGRPVAAWVEIPVRFHLR